MHPDAHQKSRIAEMEASGVAPRRAVRREGSQCVRIHALTVTDILD